MKNYGWFLLLISLGLNLGLGYKLLRPEGPAAGSPDSARSGGFRRGLGDGPGKRTEDGPFWRDMMERRLTHLAERLNLSEDQAATFRARHQAGFEPVVAQRLKVQAARGRMQTLIAAGTVDSDSVRAAIQKIGQEQSRMDSLVTEAMLAEMEILDDSQRALYLENLPASRSMGHERPGGGRRNQRNR